LDIDWLFEPKANSLKPSRPLGLQMITPCRAANQNVLPALQPTGEIFPYQRNHEIMFKITYFW